MGVPKFYRWLSERFPLINQDIADGTLLPSVDALYFDLNGHIHNATHGDGMSKTLSQHDVVMAVMRSIDRAVQLIKPRKLIYLAVDGVAPRAKMNQQRSRRFRAAADLHASKEEAMRSDESVEDVFDSNCITPGTEFMASLSEHIKYYVQRCMSENVAWRDVSVIFSGHEVPGEGEHKIVSYIRSQRLSPDYDPNTRHCMTGLDADLVMLALATHEPHFVLLREQVDFMAFKKARSGKTSEVREDREKQYQLLHIGVLREYLEIDMRPSDAVVASTPFVFDHERVIDDFVLMSALCGNDFIPHLPSLDIGEGALDNLLRTYRQHLPLWGGYLSENGIINFERLEQLLKVLADEEAEVFEWRAAEEAKFAKKQRRFGKSGGAAAAAAVEDEEESEAATEAETSGSEIVSDAKTPFMPVSDSAIHAEHRDMAMERLGVSPSARHALGPKYKVQYYFEKLGFRFGTGAKADEDMLYSMVASYTEALQWVMLYYIRGCPSWGWFYPFHYAPMISDLRNLTDIPVAFVLGKPFLPFQQLLGCLPAASANFLPACYRSLMTSPTSPLIDFYPPVQTIKTDANGKRNAWEAVTLIPFIQESQMLEAIHRHCPDTALTADERQRNSVGNAYFFVYNEACTRFVKSTLPSIFPDIPDCHVDMRVHHEHTPPIFIKDDAEMESAIAALARLGLTPTDAGAVGTTSSSLLSKPNPFFLCRPLPGCVVPAMGYPTLHTLRFTPRLRKVRLNVFGMGSKKDTLILNMTNELARYDIDAEDEEEDEEGEEEAVRAHGGDDDDDDTSRRRRRGVPASKLYRPSFSARYAPGTVVAALAAGEEHGLRHNTVESALPGDALSTLRMDAMKKLLGHVVFCDWPHLREALVEGVSDDAYTCEYKGDAEVPAAEVARAELTSGHVWASGDQPMWRVRMNELQEKLLRGNGKLGTCGVAINPSRFIITVRRLVGMHRDAETGALSRMWSSEKEEFPASVVLLSNPVQEARFMPTAGVTLEARFPPETGVVILRGPLRGCTAVVKGYAHSDSQGDLLHVMAQPTLPEPPFGRAAIASIRDEYVSTADACKALNLSTSVFGRLTGSLIVSKADIGLNLKKQQRLYKPGYVRPVEAPVRSPWGSRGGPAGATPAGSPTGMAWQFSVDALHLVHAYCEKFPEIVRMIDNAPDEKSYTFSAAGYGKGRQVELETWLKQLDVMDVPLVYATSTVLPQRVVKIIEASGARLRQAAAAKPALPPVALAIKPEDVFSFERAAISVGSISEGETARTRATRLAAGSVLPGLGDRVANLSFRRAPVSLRGVVVAIHKATNFVEVVFDDEFLGGTSLSGLCSNFRGALLPWTAVLPLDEVPAATASRADAAAAAAAAAATTAALSASEAAAAKAGGIAADEFVRRPGAGRVPAVSTASPAAAAPSAVVKRGAPKPAEASVPTTKATPPPGAGAKASPAPAAGAKLERALKTKLMEMFGAKAAASNNALCSLIRADPAREGWVPVAAIAAMLEGAPLASVKAAATGLGEAFELSPDGRLMRSTSKPYAALNEKLTSKLSPHGMAAAAGVLPAGGGDDSPAAASSAAAGAPDAPAAGGYWESQGVQFKRPAKPRKEAAAAAAPAPTVAAVSPTPAAGANILDLLASAKQVPAPVPAPALAHIAVAQAHVAAAAAMAKMGMVPSPVAPFPLGMAMPMVATPPLAAAAVPVAARVPPTMPPSPAVPVTAAASMPRVAAAAAGSEAAVTSSPAVSTPGTTSTPSAGGAGGMLRPSQVRRSGKRTTTPKE